MIYFDEICFYLKQNIVVKNKIDSESFTLNGSTRF
jgi:hypothetical protein